MIDARISKYRKAIEAIAKGQFQIDIPVNPTDEVGKLGTALVELANTIARKREEFRQNVRGVTG